MNDVQKALLTEIEGVSLFKGKEKDGHDKMSKSAFKVGIAVDGYRNWKVNFGTMWPWTNAALARLAQAMEVDAVLLINQGIDLTGGFSYRGCLITMVGENPIPKIEGKKYPGLSYCDGMVYGQAALTFYKPIEFATVKGIMKKTIKSENYNKFGEVNQVLVQTLLEDIKNRQVADTK